jgi:FMN phosphatase YigB (HAD superfamily)
VIKAVLFDLDDVLFDEKEFAIQGFMAVANYLASKYDLNGPEVFRLLRDDFKCGVRKKNFDVLLHKTGLRGERVSNLVRI